MFLDQMKRDPTGKFLWGNQAGGGGRKRGRSKTTQRNTILKEGTTMCCNTVQELHLLATDCITWRTKTSAIYVPPMDIKQ